MTARTAGRPPRQHPPRPPRTARDPGPGGRHGVPGAGVRRGRRDVRRDGLQHRDDRLPGDPDRPVLLRPDRRDDRPAHRQHRRSTTRTRSRGGSGSAATSSASRPGSRRTGGRQRSLDDELRAQGVTGIAITGTRALTRHLRERGAMRAAISTGTADPAAAAASGCWPARRWPAPTWPRGVHRAALHGRAAAGTATRSVPGRGGRPRHQGRDPAAMAPARLRRSPCCPPAAGPRHGDPGRPGPDGVFFSNGPGDPAALGYASTPCAGCWPPACRCSASAWAARSSAGPSAWAPTSCASATAG